MAKTPLPMPTTSQRAVQPPQGVLDPLYYQLIKSLVDALSERITASQMTTSTTTPTAADIPDGESRVWKNTGAGTVRLYVNDGGSLKSALLS